MYGVDTNVLVRLLVNDDLDQQTAILKRLESIRDEGGSVLVGVVVIAELTWVLKAVYGYERREIAAAVEQVMWTPPFHVPERGVVQRALAWYAQGTAGLSDYLILAQALEQGADRLLTFDRQLLRNPACEAP